MNQWVKIALLDLFKDHYWDSLEKDREEILAHIEAVMSMYESVEESLLDLIKYDKEELHKIRLGMEEEL